MTGKDMQCAVIELCADREMPPLDIHTQLQCAYGDDCMGTKCQTMKNNFKNMYRHQ
jgi:hypothetical protein